jgi:hypothetical protein
MSRRIFLLACLTACTVHANTVTKDEAQVLDLFVPIFNQLTGAGQTVRINLLAPGQTPDLGNTPFAMGRSNRDHACVLVVRVEGLQSYAMIRSDIDGSEEFIQGLLAHEAGHCLESRTEDHNTLGEPRADAFAVLWERRFDPTHAEHFYHSLTKMRRKFQDPKYPTRYLAAVWNQALSGAETVEQLYSLAQGIVN